MTLRFVVLEHDWDGVHYDLMLERDQVLKTWRLGALPSEVEQEALELPDHRLEYLSYEGPVSRGRGTVRRVAAGVYVVVEEGKGRLRVQFLGELEGELVLARIQEMQWTVRFVRGDRS
jgi:hypothetical protein